MRVKASVRARVSADRAQLAAVRPAAAWGLVTPDGAIFMTRATRRALIERVTEPGNPWRKWRRGGWRIIPVRIVPMRASDQKGGE